MICQGWKGALCAVFKSTACRADAQRAAKAAQGPAVQPPSAGQEPEQDEEDDLLPPQVLAAIAKQSQ